MNYLDEIQNTVDDIIAILEKYDDDWANVFKRIKNNLYLNQKNTIRDIRYLYGGMGSFNDFVFQKDGNMPKDDNHKLYELRTKLYEVCCQQTLS